MSAILVNRQSLFGQNKIVTKTLFGDINLPVGNPDNRIEKEQNLSQAQLAKKIGIKQQILAGYEIASRRIPVSMLFPIAAALFVRVEDLLGINYKSKPGPMSKIERKIEFIKTLPENKQKKILELIDSAVEIAS